MKPEIKQKWIDKLNSGEVPQITHQLSYGPGRCCLGVLCDVLEIPREGIFYNFDGYLEDVEIPKQYCEDVIELPYKLSITLQNMNDDGSSFEEIAEFIDKEPF